MINKIAAALNIKIKEIVSYKGDEYVAVCRKKLPRKYVLICLMILLMNQADLCIGFPLQKKENLF